MYYIRDTGDNSLLTKASNWRALPLGSADDQDDLAAFHCAADAQTACDLMHSLGRTLSPYRLPDADETYCPDCAHGSSAHDEFGRCQISCCSCMGWQE